MVELSSYELVVGLEVHIQLQTESKLFAPDRATFGQEANENVSYITAAHPGTLPRINERAVEYALKLGLALGCEINQHNFFDRKNYFYPDLPKGYQVSQDNIPICGAGLFELKDFENIGINRIHIEEDAGKSIHDLDENYSFIDLNRSGVALLEVVSEPCIHSAAQAVEYLTEMRKLVRWLEIGDGNMEEGSLRCDANISVRKVGDKKLGRKAEIKNMNSIRNVKRAVVYEYKRQVEILEHGGEVVQETRGFDATRGITHAQRIKEEAHDYRYFPEPDLSLLYISDTELDEAKRNLPELPKHRMQRYGQEYGLSAYDANILTETKEIGAYFEEVLRHTKQYKKAANWMINSIKAYLNENQIEMQDFDLAPNKVAEIINLIDTNKINQKTAKEVLFPALMEDAFQEVNDLAVSLNVLIENDNQEVQHLIREILDQHPNEVKRFRQGNKGLIGFFMGALMKVSKGKIDPKSANQLLLEQLKLDK